MTNNENTPTLRDQFAMAVLTGFTSNIDRFDLTQKGRGHWIREDIAKTAYMMADAMLEERKE